MPLGTCTLVHCSEDSLLTTAPGKWGEEGRERDGGRKGERGGERGMGEGREVEATMKEKPV